MEATKRNLFKEVTDMFRFLRDSNIAKYGDTQPERTWTFEMIADLFEKAYMANQRGEPLAWINFAVIPEIFWAMDLVPVVLDTIHGMAAGTPEGVTKYIDIAEQHIPDHVCSDNKVLLGAALAGEVPIPDMLIHPSHPCDSNVATFPVIAQYFDKPYFCIDVPYFRNERTRQYVADELKRLVSFLEEVTGRKLDMDRLREVMEYSNRAHELILKSGELRAAVPCPYSTIETVSEYVPFLGLPGTPQLVDYCEKRYAWAKERVDRGEGHLKDEKIRLVWLYGAPVFDFALFPWLEKQYGAITVGNMNSNFIIEPVEGISDPDNIFRGLAEKVLRLPMGRECGGPWENFINASLDHCSRLKADAAIFAGHIACKANWAIMKLVKDRIMDELGIPVLIFETDLFDPRIVSAEAIRAKFEDFFETYF